MKVFALAALLTLSVTVVFGRIVIAVLKKRRLSQTILFYVEEHKNKNGTPTMGGIIFILPTLIIAPLFISGSRSFSFVSLGALAAFAVIGFFDDLIKIKYKKNEGLTAWQKIVFQSILALIVSVFVYRMGIKEQYIPFTHIKIDLGAWFIPIGVIIFLSTSNCVNLTDGLDGLAATSSAVYLIFSAILIFVEINYLPADINAQAEYKNLSLTCAVCAAALCGYLVYNTNKASVFMGDTGSLALGGFNACVLILSGNAFYIPLLGITFVMSGVSVIVQVLHYKRTGKRVFLMAPLHHHFQHKGYTESKITYAYKTISVIFGLISILVFLGE